MRMPKLATAALLALLAVPLPAQDYNPLDPNLRTQLDAARGVLEKERRIVLASELNLTREERDKFWPLFNEYADDLRKVNDLRVDTIVRYAESYPQMTNAIARELVDDSLRYERELLKLHERYLKRMRRVLPETKVARFFQVEAKMAATLNYGLAAQIPVIPDPPRPP
jgi:Spy/CpxP family protein refolding chaperone